MPNEEKRREAMVNIIKKLSDVRFDIEWYIIEYGDETDNLVEISRELTARMQQLGTKFLFYGE